ncbi:MAG: hypothetical protein K9L98_01370 [Candidatus Pacebacteria bacterium]|nr:hypothetical protein [Candidatus Paceibacterota bacterium]MCF7862642.1 hypothetical protein [Candidatus Paceibacterota bacterium]
MSRISDLYKKYKIMPNLELHMLRVASVAKIICANLIDPLSKEDEDNIVKSLLLHDFGNIVKADFSVFPKEFYDPEGIDFWRDVQQQFVQKYGENDHEANKKIAEEMEVSKKVIDFIDVLEFSSLCRNLESGSLPIQILVYSDLRVGPYGVLSYEERMDEANKRYQHPEQEERQKLVSCGKKIEEIVFKNSKIKPNDINDQSILPVLEELKEFVI